MWEEEMNLHHTKREVGVSNLVFFAPSQPLQLYQGKKEVGRGNGFASYKERTHVLTWPGVLFQELEEEVNLHYEELVVDKSHDQLLASQLQALLVGFDVYLETEVLDVSAPVEIPKEKVIPRVFRSVDVLG